MLYKIKFINLMQLYFQQAQMVPMFLNLLLNCLPQIHWMEFQNFIAQHVINMNQKLIIILDVYLILHLIKYLQLLSHSVMLPSHSDML